MEEQKSKYIITRKTAPKIVRLLKDFDWNVLKNSIPKDIVEKYKDDSDGLKEWLQDNTDDEGNGFKILKEILMLLNESSFKLIDEIIADIAGIDIKEFADMELDLYIEKVIDVFKNSNFTRIFKSAFS